MEFVEPQYVSLKTHPRLRESWLQEKIGDSPSLLGLGDLVVQDTERAQPNAGRLDLLLADPKTNRRYEVEIQLGATDESHIIRTLEYWDIERKRYPKFEHIAVIVAEDVTRRFLNVIALFNQAIPIIAIQLKAVEINGALTLVATKVLDWTPAPDEDAPEAVDRSDWESRSAADMLPVCDEIAAIMRTVQPGTKQRYTKGYIGLSGVEGLRNLVVLEPRKEYVVAKFKIRRNDDTERMIAESNFEELEYIERWNEYRVKVTRSNLDENRATIKELIRQAHDQYGRGG